MMIGLRMEVYYFGEFGAYPDAPATHTFFDGPMATAFTIWPTPPYNVTASQVCTYKLIVLT